MDPAIFPPAIVLACAGAPHGALNAVRSLGLKGVPVHVVTEGQAPAVESSRHVVASWRIEGFSKDPNGFIKVVEGVANLSGRRPVIIPTADPDLSVLMQTKDALSGICEMAIPDPALGLLLMDKGRFAHAAESLGLPVPATRMPRHEGDLQGIATELSFPVIAKPANPNNWRPQEVEGLSWSTKAIRLESGEDLINMGGELIRRGNPLVVQEFIPGKDLEHVDLHAHIDRRGNITGIFTGRKWRLFPPHAGSGCLAQSEYLPDVIELGLDCLRKLGYRGLANLNFKRHEGTGKYWLLEINPRLSQWHILTTRCGVNLPWLAYSDAAGLCSSPSLTQDCGKWYLNFAEDRKAFRQYYREGSIGIKAYAASLCRPWQTVYQQWSWVDPVPAMASLVDKIRRRVVQRLPPS